MRKILMAGAAALVATSANAQASSSAAQPAAAVADNILLKDWAGPYDGVPPWDKVAPAQFPQAIQASIDELLIEARSIADNPAAPTFENTIEAMEKSGQRLDRVLSVFGVMTSNTTNPQYQALDKEWSPKLSAAFDQIILNPWA